MSPDKADLCWFAMRPRTRAYARKAFPGEYVDKRFVIVERLVDGTFSRLGIEPESEVEPAAYLKSLNANEPGLLAIMAYAAAAISTGEPATYISSQEIAAMRNATLPLVWLQDVLGKLELAETEPQGRA
jgi:hypothetical protein